MSHNDRQALFERLRHALDDHRAQTPEQAIAELNRHLGEENPRPEWSEPLVEHFIERLETAAGVCLRISDSSQLLDAISTALQAGLAGQHPAPVGIMAHPLLQGIAWPTAWRVSSETALASHFKAAITVAPTAIAETGSLVLPSGPQRATTLNFLPDLHVVILRAVDIVEYMEDAWERLRLHGSLPRTVNLITGPSRTADVEQTLQLGAHGPRQLYVILLD